MIIATIALTMVNVSGVTANEVIIYDGYSDVFYEEFYEEPEDYSINANDVIINEGVDDYYIQIATDYWNKLPEVVKRKFAQKGWNLVVTSKNLANTYFYGIYTSVQGAIRYEEKRIYIEDREVACKNAVIHEFGHYIDFYLGNISYTEEFANIFYEERYGLIGLDGVDNHCISTSIEFFAEVFNQMILHPETCKSSVPKSFNFIQECINSLE